MSGAGLLEDTDCTIHVLTIRSVVVRRVSAESRFGTDYRGKAQDWYNPDHRVDFAGTLKIWKPTLVLADSILYNAVAQTTLPPDSAAGHQYQPVASRRQSAGVQRRLLVSTDPSHRQPCSIKPGSTQVIDCGRVRLYRVVIEDAAGQRLPESFFSVDRTLGLVTMSPTLNLTGYAYRMRYCIPLPICVELRRRTSAERSYSIKRFRMSIR